MPSPPPDKTGPTLSGGLVRLVDQPPAVLPAVILEDTVPFPGPVVPVLLNHQRRREAVLAAKNLSGFFVLINRRSRSSANLSDHLSRMDDKTAREMVAQAVGPEDGGPRSESIVIEHEPHEEPEENEGKPLTLDQLGRVGILARLIKVVRLPDERLSALVQLMRRIQPVEVVAEAPYCQLRVMYPVEMPRDQDAFAALYRQVKVNLQAFFSAHPTVSDELKVAALSIDVPGHVADFVAQHLSRDHDERLAFLAELDLTRRMRRALEVTIRELDLLNVGNRISQEIRDKVEKHQRDFLLREQLKAIRHELGEERDPAALATGELRAKLKKAGLSGEARSRADEELKRLSLLPAESPEHNVVRSYLEWIAALPWSKVSEDRHDIAHARRVLDEDHFGLEEIKQRIVEFLAVHQLNPKKVGTLMCLSGPPGVGKTSLGQSIARALGREFYRFSVGGMRDEAEIKGHRRTYIGAMPGRILQGLKMVKTANPVFMLDELDKMGSDWRGDPSSALLEVLDPAQNKNFSDHYLDLPFDLSRVMFIATVNISTEIPAPLRDRLEVIDLPGYIPEEKLEIARRYLVPRQRKEHGLKLHQLKISPDALRRVIGEYTHEAGVRELERAVGKICRKRAMAVVEGKRRGERIGTKEVPELLGPSRHHDDDVRPTLPPGVALGLAWTPYGGEVLIIEAVAMPGKGERKVTGQVGGVMNESTEVAMSFVESNAKALGVDGEFFAKNKLHVHIAAGAVKKDGPSAGITVTTAILSLLTATPITPRLAMTGEMTLRGEILPVGGIREKVVAARRKRRVHTLIIPEGNRPDVMEIPEALRANLRFYFVRDFSEVQRLALPAPKRAAAAATPARRGKTRRAARPPAGGKSAEVPKRAARPPKRRTV